MTSPPNGLDAQGWLDGELEALRERADFWLDEKLIAEVLALAGETRPGHDQPE